MKPAPPVTSARRPCHAVCFSGPVILGIGFFSIGRTYYTVPAFSSGKTYRRVRWGSSYAEKDVKAARDNERLRVLLRRSAIERRVREMAREITADFRGQRLHLIGVLKGASIFLSDLIREIRLEVSLDFIAVASYGQSTHSSGQVRLTKDLDNSIEGLHTILVEDILDTGLTIAYLQRVLLQRKPQSLRVATLLRKTAPRAKEIRPDYVGFEIPNEFVVGYGLDFAERYRNLRDICVLQLAGSKGIRP
jgi:hypoxanthine phosphoribosyltransferase